METQMTKYRWRVVALLFAATTINYLDRQVLGLLKPTLEAEFGWKESDFSHIVMAFQAAYAVSLHTLRSMTSNHPRSLVMK